MKQKNLIYLLLVLILPVFCVRFYYEVVPRGASLEPFVGYSRELNSITSPQGKIYRVFVNDAGAMHSGKHWVWVIDQGWIAGRYVVLEGYVDSEVAAGDAQLLVQWKGEQPIIQFESARY